MADCALTLTHGSRHIITNISFSYVTPRPARQQRTNILTLWHAVGSNVPSDRPTSPLSWLELEESPPSVLGQQALSPSTAMKHQETEIIHLPASQRPRDKLPNGQLPCFSLEEGNQNPHANDSTLTKLYKEWPVLST